MEGGRKEMGEEKDAGQREEGRETYSHLGKPRGFQGYMSEWEAQGLLEKEHSCGAVLSRDVLGDNSLVQ